MPTDSLWAHAPFTLTDPAPVIPSADSPWVFDDFTLRKPHYPVGVYVGGVVRYVPIQSYIGGHLR